MHPDRVIVRTYIMLDVLSTIPVGLNTLYFQSADKNDSPWDPLLSPIINTALPIGFSNFPHEDTCDIIGDHLNKDDILRLTTFK